MNIEKHVVDITVTESMIDQLINNEITDYVSRANKFIANKSIDNKSLANRSIAKYNGTVFRSKDSRGVPETRLDKRFKKRIVLRRTVTTRLNLFCKRQTWFDLNWVCNVDKNSRQKKN